MIVTTAAREKSRPFLPATPRANNSDKDQNASDQSSLVVVVEDDTDIAESLVELLESEGYRVATYANGRQALEALESGSELPALIVLDLTMPEMDGWTFRVEQRKRPRLREIPVIATSADCSSKAAAIDADVFLPKPLNIERLLAATREAQVAAERRKLLATSIELERLRSLGMLVGTVAHQVNNPLQYVLGSLELAARDCQRLGDAASPILRSVSNALTGANTIAEIIRGLRTFARLETRDTRADVIRALEAATQLSEHALQGVTIERTYDPQIPLVVGNEAKLSQVFLNLLVNAAQAIKSGAAERKFVAISVKVEGARVVVNIHDTGAGMTPEVLARAFEPFFTTKPPEQGTGIGLSFCREVVEAIGGTITAQSVLGAGSTFCIQLAVAGAQN